jgi:NAD(P)-dependent dehydrogenase (short-subunit alcohol dehydrogenase family)
MRIAGKRILITGASSGIGRATALALSDRGAALALAARRRDRLQAVAAQIAAAHPGSARPVVVPCDVTDADQVCGAVEAAAAQLGGLDVLINNAGVSVYGSASRTTVRDYRDVFEVNFFGPLLGMRAAFPHLAAGGVIVNVVSAAGLRGVPYLAAYSASKAALAALGQSLRAEMAADGVRVVNLYPGYTDTPIFRHERHVGGARRPAGPYPPPTRVARAIVRSLERGRQEVFVSPESRSLALLRHLPTAADQVMGWIALRLRDRAVAHA